LRHRDQADEVERAR
jgi:hypothetical protein